MNVPHNFRRTDTEMSNVDSKSQNSENLEQRVHEIEEVQEAQSRERQSLKMNESGYSYSPPRNRHRDGPEWHHRGRQSPPKTYTMLRTHKKDTMPAHSNKEHPPFGHEEVHTPHQAERPVQTKRSQVRFQDDPYFEQPQNYRHAEDAVRDQGSPARDHACHNQQPAYNSQQPAHD